MIKEKLFAVAVFAFRPDPRHVVQSAEERRITTGLQFSDVRPLRFTELLSCFPSVSDAGESKFNHEYAFDVGYELAATKEIAEEAALKRAKEMFPESERWTLHRTCAQEIYAEDIVRASASLTFGIEQESSEDSSGDEWPDMIM